MKARQREVELEKQERSKEIDSERYKHRLDEAVQHFTALLVDMVSIQDCCQHNMAVVCVCARVCV